MGIVFCVCRREWNMEMTIWRWWSSRSRFCSAEWIDGYGGRWWKIASSLLRHRSKTWLRRTLWSSVSAAVWWIFKDTIRDYRKMVRSNSLCMLPQSEVLWGRWVKESVAYPDISDNCIEVIRSIRSQQKLSFFICDSSEIFLRFFEELKVVRNVW